MQDAQRRLNRKLFLMMSHQVKLSQRTETVSSTPREPLHSKAKRLFQTFVDFCRKSPLPQNLLQAHNLPAAWDW